MALLTRASITLLAATLAACAVGPDYHRPAAPVAASFSARDAGDASTGPVLEFWRGFDDPLLTQLVENALAANTDLRVALARLDQARALTRQSQLDFFPQVTAQAGHSSARASADQAPGVADGDRDAKLHTASADAFWELDLFGRVRRNVEASRADAAATAEDLKALQVTVAAEVARSYFELRGAQERLRVARGNADNQAQTLRLTQARDEAGRGTAFDVQRSRAALESTLSRIPALEAQIAVLAHRIGVLTGREPASLRATLEKPAALPALPRSVAVGTPAELLRRRPDIQAAERRVAAATARIGVATADLFPRVTFGGSIGVAASDLGELFTPGGEHWSFGPQIRWAFLDLGRVRARIAASDAAASASLAQYEGTVLRALEEVESALVTWAHTQREAAHLQASAEASNDAAGLASARFDAGASDFLQVLDAQRSQLEAQDRLAQVRTRSATSLIAVYKSVAGGWPQRLSRQQARAHKEVQS